MHRDLLRVHLRQQGSHCCACWGLPDYTTEVNDPIASSWDLWRAHHTDEGSHCSLDAPVHMAIRYVAPGHRQSGHRQPGNGLFYTRFVQRDSVCIGQWRNSKSSARPVLSGALRQGHTSEGCSETSRRGKAQAPRHMQAGHKAGQHPRTPRRTRRRQTSSARPGPAGSGSCSPRCTGDCRV